MRHIIYEIVRPGTKNHKTGKRYDIAISVIVIISLFPMMFKGDAPWKKPLDVITADIILFDYILRWMTYDIRIGEEGKASAFIRYFFNPIALVTFISLLPSFRILGESWRMLRILRIMTMFGYSKHFEKIINVFSKQKERLTIVLAMALMYIFACALLIFTVEPDTFDNFFQAVYWSTTALTTVGYGDLVPHTDIGKLISMLSSLFGIAIIALPAGIITSGFMEELNAEKNVAGTPSESPKKRIIAEIERLRVLRTDGERKAFSRNILIMLLCVVLNCGLFTICRTLNLPVWMDLTGTVFAAVLIEPCAGILVGFFTNCFETFSSFDGAILFFMTSAAAAIIPGLLIRTRKGEIKRKMFLPAMGLTTVITSVVATIQVLLFVGGVPDNYWEFKWYTALQGIGMPKVCSVFLPVLLVKIPDLLVVFAALYFATKSEAFMNLIHGAGSGDSPGGQGK